MNCYSLFTQHQLTRSFSFTCARCFARIQRVKNLKFYDGIGPRPPISAKNSSALLLFSSSAISASLDCVVSVKADMLPSSSSKGKTNPFLTEETDFWALSSSSKSCRFPMCQNDADQNHLTCEVHSNMKLPVSPKTAKISTVKHPDIVPLADSRRDSVQSAHMNGNGHTTNGSKHMSDASLSPTGNRKNLEAKTTARKTVMTRRPFIASTDHKPTSRSDQNGHSSGVTAKEFQRPTKHMRKSLGDMQPRKKQRLITPSSEELSARPANSASPLARPSGFGIGKSNGETAPPPRLPTLSKDDEQTSSLSAPKSGTTKSKIKSILGRGLSTYADYINHSPTPVLPRLGNADVPRLNIGTPVGPTMAPVSGYDADLSSRDTSRHASVDDHGGSKSPDTNKTNKTKPSTDTLPHLSRNGSSHSNQTSGIPSRPLPSPKVAAPAKMTLDQIPSRPLPSPKVATSAKSTANQIPSRTLPSPKEATSAKTTTDQIKVNIVENKDSSRSSSEWITRAPPLEQLRRRVAEQRAIDSATFDAYIYGQSNSQAPPPGLVIQQPPQPPKVISAEDAFSIHMDPRSSRIRPHTEEWYRQKEEEIAARGGRKANCGKAVQRLAEQRRNEPQDIESFKETLPDRVRNDDDWVAAALFFRDRIAGKPISAAQQPSPAEAVTPVRVKRKYVRKQQPVPPQPALGGKKPAGPDAA